MNSSEPSMGYGLAPAWHTVAHPAFPWWEDEGDDVSNWEKERQRSIIEMEHLFHFAKILGEPWSGISRHPTKGSKADRTRLQETATTQDQIESSHQHAEHIWMNYSPHTLETYPMVHCPIPDQIFMGPGISMVPIGPGHRDLDDSLDGIVEWLRDPGRRHGCLDRNHAGHLITTGIGNDRKSLVAATLRRTIAIGLDPRQHRIAIFEHGRHTHAIFSTINLNGERWRTPFGVTWILWAQDNWDRLRNNNRSLPPLIARTRTAEWVMRKAAAGQLQAHIGNRALPLTSDVTEQTICRYLPCWCGCLPIKEAISKLAAPRSISDMVRYCARAG